MIQKGAGFYIIGFLLFLSLGIATFSSVWFFEANGSVADGTDKIPQVEKYFI